MSNFEIKPYNSKQLALLYGVGYRLFLNWIKEIKETTDIGKQVGNCWNIRQVKIIISQLDKPE